MPRERTELIRPSKSLIKTKIFVLAYEGNDTEPQYYEALKEDLKFKNFSVHIESMKRDKNDTKSAPKHVFNKLKEIKKEVNFNSTDEFWMIIDTDSWKLNDWIDKCNEESNFYIALSNPCFEFWLLLHIKSLRDFSKEEHHKIFKNAKISNNHNYVSSLLTELLTDGYNKSNIKPERFIKKVLLAVAEAKKLDDKDIMKNLGSHNYKLIEKLFNAD